MTASRTPKSGAGASIATEITVLIVAASILISLIAGSLQGYSDYRAGMAQLEEEFRLIGVSHVPALSENVWALDKKQVESELDGIISLPAIVSAEVTGDLPWSSKRSRELPTEDSSVLVRDFEYGRIVAVADVFDALTSIRPYKEAWAIERAQAYLRDQAGAHFDPQCVEGLLGCWRRDLIDSR